MPPNPSLPRLPHPSGTTARSGIGVCLVAGLALLAACGGASPPSKTYGGGDAGLAEAEADLDAEEMAIALHFGPVGGATSAPGGYPAPSEGYPQPPAQPPFAQPAQPAPPPRDGATAAPPPTPAGPPPSAPLAAASPAQEADGFEEGEAQEREQSCALACRSLEAMRRAAGHICRAAGPDDPRCGRAKGRVDAAAQKVDEACDECG